MSPLLWALSVLVLLGVLILVHELGHFIFARLFAAPLALISNLRRMATRSNGNPVRSTARVAAG